MNIAKAPIYIPAPRDIHALIDWQEIAMGAWVFAALASVWLLILTAYVVVNAPGVGQ